MYFCWSLFVLQLLCLRLWIWKAIQLPKAQSSRCYGGEYISWHMRRLLMHCLFPPDDHTSTLICLHFSAREGTPERGRASPRSPFLYPNLCFRTSGWERGTLQHYCLVVLLITGVPRFFLFVLLKSFERWLPPSPQKKCHSAFDSFRRTKVCGTAQSWSSFFDMHPSTPYAGGNQLICETLFVYDGER